MRFIALLCGGAAAVGSVPLRFRSFILLYQTLYLVERPAEFSQLLMGQHHCGGAFASVSDAQRQHLRDVRREPDDAVLRASADLKLYLPKWFFSRSFVHASRLSR